MKLTVVIDVPDSDPDYRDAMRWAQTLVRDAWTDGLRHPIGAEWGDALAERDDLRRQYASVTDELTAAYLGANEFVSNVTVTRFPPAPITEDKAR